MQYTVYTKYIFDHALGYIEGEFESKMYARLIIGLIVVVVSMVYLFAYAIPNYYQAQENLRIAQAEYDQSQLELQQSMDEVNRQIEALNN